MNDCRSPHAMHLRPAYRASSLPYRLPRRRGRKRYSVQSLLRNCKHELMAGHMHGAVCSNYSYCAHVHVCAMRKYTPGPPIDVQLAIARKLRARARARATRTNDIDHEISKGLRMIIRVIEKAAASLIRHWLCAAACAYAVQLPWLQMIRSSKAEGRRRSVAALACVVQCPRRVQHTCRWPRKRQPLIRCVGAHRRPSGAGGASAHAQAFSHRLQG
jgi:hypothetical protein